MFEGERDHQRHSEVGADVGLRNRAAHGGDHDAGRADRKRREPRGINQSQVERLRKDRGELGVGQWRREAEGCRERAVLAQIPARAATRSPTSTRKNAGNLLAWR